MTRIYPFLALAAALAACSGGNALPTGPSPVAASIELEYRAVGPSEASTAAGLDCIGRVRVHPSWWGFSQVTMVSAGPERWSLLFEDVPIGEQRVELSVPEGCGTGALTANGTPLERTGAGFTFVVHPDGSIVP